MAEPPNGFLASNSTPSSTFDGYIVGAALLPGNWHNRDVVVALNFSTDGGIWRKTVELAQGADDYQNMSEHKAFISSIRQRVETFFDQLSHH